MLKTIKGKPERPLNKLTPMEYAEDFELYLQHCPETYQRNLRTYFDEFEHQEGSISEDTKKKTAIIVARRVMAKFYVEIDNLRASVQEDVIDILMNSVEMFDPKVESTYERALEYSERATKAIQRGYETFR